MEEKKEIEKLKFLLDEGVITQEEYEAKLGLMKSEKESKKDNTEEVGSFDISKLDDLKKLLEEELITKDEYAAKVAHICGISIKDNVKESKTNTTPSTWVKRNVISLVIIALLIGGIGFIYSYYLSAKKDALKYQDELRERGKEVSDLTTDVSNLKSGLWFFLNNTYICVEGDDTYYHRYMCPDTKMANGNYRFYAFNDSQAESNGYKKCPTCVDMDTDQYIDYYID